MAPDQHRCATGAASRRDPGASSCGCPDGDPAAAEPDRSAVPAHGLDRLPAPAVGALRDAATAPDPVERFPFLVLDPEAAPRRHPDAPDPTGIEFDAGRLRPGPELARLLTTLDPTEMSDWMLVELTDAAVRLTSWAQAVAAHLAGTLATRGSMAPDDLRVVGGPTPDQVAGTELALRMRWTRASATALVRRGRAFDGALAPTGTALARGEIDGVRADAVVRRLADEPVPVALDAQDAVLPAASQRTAPELRRDLERALLATDPDDARARRDRARARRRVERPTVLPDGMSCVRAVLPAPDAVRMHTVLDAAARAARAAGDGRTLDQLRADGLVDLVLHDACAAEAPDEIAVTAAQIAVEDETAGAPGAPRVPGAQRVPGAGGPRVCRARRRPDAQVRVTVALPTLLGLDDRPADLDGYGPLHAVTARALAAGGVLRRMVTDPLSGTLLDLGRTRYRPTAALAEHVQARDGTCVRPGCGVPARSCDLDHTRDFHQRPADGGERGGTSDDNLACLCPTDHRMKTVAGFRLRQREPGRFQWVTPTGHVYDVGPVGVEPPDLRLVMTEPPWSDVASSWLPTTAPSRDPHLSSRPPSSTTTESASSPGFRLIGAPPSSTATESASSPGFGSVAAPSSPAPPSPASPSPAPSSPASPSSALPSPALPSAGPPPAAPSDQHPRDVPPF